MKKIICILLIIVIASLTLVSCSSTITPTSTPYWTDGEMLSYTVRKASDYELNLVGLFNENYHQVIPSDANGYYATRVTAIDESNYSVETVLDVVETYTKEDFGNDLDFFNTVKVLAEANDTDALAFDGTNIVVHTMVNSVAQFNKTTFLPTRSEKTIQNAVFARPSTVKGHENSGSCEINDITITTEYDYSAKAPKVTVKSSMQEEDTVTKLQKSSATKTYDNEQLAFLLRSFSLDTLKANLSTPVTLFDSMQNTALALTITVTSSPAFNYQIGGVMTGIDEEGKHLYLKSKDGTQYLDMNGEVVETIERSVAQVYLNTGGKPIYYYFDNKNRDDQTFKNTLIRMQQGYLVFDIDQQSLDTL